MTQTDCIAIFSEYIANVANSFRFCEFLSVLRICISKYNGKDDGSIILRECGTRTRSSSLRLCLCYSFGEVASVRQNVYNSPNNVQSHANHAFSSEYVVAPSCIGVLFPISTSLSTIGELK